MANTPDADEPSGRHESLWLATAPDTDYDALDGDLRVDAAVVGGGIVGVTTALKLTEAGRSVALLEQDRIVRGVTGHTTAKLTSLHGLVYDHLVDSFGAERARKYGAANEAAIDDVEATAEAYDVDCSFTRAPAYTYAESGAERRKVHAEVAAARRLGLPASRVEETELPFGVAGAVRFEEQAHFDPRRYLLGLARQVADDGHVFEKTSVDAVSDGDPCRVETDRGDVVADDVVVATHFPILDPMLYFARLSPKRSYVLAARLADDPPEGMYYRPGDPYFSVRPHPAGDGATVLFGGQNHRTGAGGDTTRRYRALERTVRRRFDVESVEYRWSTQDYVSVDRIPLVGSAAPWMDHVYVATGFGGWGMTNGTAAALMLRDEILDRENEWADAFRPTRLKLRASLKHLFSHNSHAARYFVGDRVTGTPRDGSDLAPGEGRVYEDRDEPLAVHRDEDGDVHAVSAVCPHMGCLVRWNDGEQSWDCPCHGSRFDVDGTVLDTPAVRGLKRCEVDEREGTERGGTERGGAE